MSSEPQRVSAVLASGVNPGGSGAPNHSSSVAQTHKRGPVTPIDKGAGVGSSDLRTPPEEMAEAFGAGWNCGTNPKSAAKHSICGVRKRLFACATRNWGSSSLPVSYPGWGRGFCPRCRSS